MFQKLTAEERDQSLKKVGAREMMEMLFSLQLMVNLGIFSAAQSDGQALIAVHQWDLEQTAGTSKHICMTPFKRAAESFLQLHTHTLSQHE